MLREKSERGELIYSSEGLLPRQWDHQYEMARTQPSYRGWFLFATQIWKHKDKWPEHNIHGVGWRLLYQNHYRESS